MVSTLEEKEKLRAFAKQVDVISLENENIPPQVIEDLQAITPVYPGVAALRCAGDRLNEKTLAKQLDIPCGRYYPVDSSEELQEAMDQLKKPAILKTRRLGYDGKGQWRLNPNGSYEQVCQQTRGQSCILEEVVDFTSECSLLAVRNVKKETRFYPLMHNVHEQGILRRSWVGDFSCELQERAQQYGSRLLEHLDYVGVLAIEFFLTRDGALWFNEMAPRVHNSGHLTIEACNVSQFESHLRAVCDMPLPEIKVTRHHLFMQNVIGEKPNTSWQGQESLVGVYDYGKTPRPGRKCGHLVFSNHK